MYFSIPVQNGYEQRREDEELHICGDIPQVQKTLLSVGNKSSIRETSELVSKKWTAVTQNNYHIFAEYKVIDV